MMAAQRGRDPLPENECKIRYHLETYVTLKRAVRGNNEAEEPGDNLRVRGLKYFLTLPIPL